MCVCVCDACMAKIEGGVITALHHQITNLTQTRYTKGWRGETDIVHTSIMISLSNFWHQMILQGISPVQCIENNLLIHTFSAAQCLVKPLAMYHPQIVAPLMPLVHTASASCHKLTHLGAVAVISRNSGAMSVFAFDPPPWLLMNVTAWRPQRTFGHFVVVVTIRRTTCAADKCPTLIRRTSLGKSRIPTESDI